MTTQAITGRHRAKIDPIQKPTEETLAWAQSINLHELGPGHLAVGEWEAAGLDLPDQSIIREHRLNRVREQLKKYDYAGIVLFDPLNTRYATDSTNMQLWVTHDAARYAMVMADGPVIMFDYGTTKFLNNHNPLIDEVRSATSWFYFSAGDRIEEMAERWGAEIADIVREHGGGNTRLALDRCNPEGLRALESRGIEVKNGEEVMENARLIKCGEEIKMMRCSILACENAMEVMRKNMRPGMSEQRLWSYLHAENIARGGEWIECRLMTAGVRTNPWFQDCSANIINDGDFVAFDTDLIGSYGICVDISRTWIAGDKKPTADQQKIYAMAYEQIVRNTEWLKPGLTFEQLTMDSFQYDPNVYRRYSCQYHGVGLADEYPCIYWPENFESAGYHGVLQPGMVICVESYVGAIAGGQGVKLEEQVLITEDGHEKLSNYPIAEILGSN